MSRLPRPLARRLDRLARRAHRFHRLAHHPLCPPYAGEVLRWRRWSVCRGCAAAAAGGAAGLAAAATLPAPPGPALLAVAALLGLALPRAVAAGRPRRSKLFTRGGPAALSAATVGWGAGAFTPAGVLAAALAVTAVGLAVLAYRRRGPDRGPCLDCPERLAPVTCGGLRHVVRREAALGRLSGRLAAAASSPMGVPGGRGGAMIQGE